jgi:4-hydroxybenzoate polyprenyltransferase/phosphoserine phosphatase
MAQTEDHPLLCVDLDGTLVATDTLHECLLCMARHRPWQVFLLPFWLLRGKAYFKHRVADATAGLLGQLPYREAVVAYIREHSNGSGGVLLTTAADERIARQVAKELPIFAHVLASDSRTNLSGERKLEEIKRYAEGRPFAYMGDHRKDIPIWLASQCAIMVGNSEKLRSQIGPGPNLVVIPKERNATLRDWIRQLRCHQWSKNLLLLVPLVLGHLVTHLPSLFAAIMAVAAFSMMASAVYIANDLIDLPYDRQHPKKSKRPIASGAISIQAAALAAVVLTAGAFLISILFLSPAFIGALLGYVAMNAAYSLWLKRVEIVDVILLAGFYIYRVIVGAIAIDVVPTFWLLVFSMFFFLGLGIVKRFSDLVLAAKAEQAAFPGRSYDTGDIEFFRTIGVASSCVAVLVLALYLQSREVTQLYQHPMYLWLVCPLVLYWSMRTWLVAQRGEMPDDPIAFALRDPASYVVGALAALLLVLAAW